MQRHRQIAAAPKRASRETWATISQLIADSLATSKLNAGDIQTALDHAAGVGRALVASMQLDNDPIVLVAGKLWVEINTVTGDSALSLAEKLDPVAGAADASDFTIYLPSTGTLAATVRDVVKGNPHLSDATPEQQTEQKAAATVSAIDEDSLARWAKEQR